MHELLQVKDRLALNLVRVRGLISAYMRHSAEGDDPTDLLRAAVVLLHATMEDLMRTLEELGLASASPTTLRRFGIVYGAPLPEKLALADLATEYPGASVAEVIGQGIQTYLEHKTYNNCNDLAAALYRIELKPTALMAPFARKLEAMMRRRHHIVHRVDMATKADRPQASDGTVPLELELVGSWVETVERFGHTVLEHSNRRAA